MRAAAITLELLGDPGKTIHICAQCPEALLSGWSTQLKSTAVPLSSGTAGWRETAPYQEAETKRPPLVVAIPAKDEAATIGRALEALGRQQGESSSSLRVIVLANGCQDDTAGTARRLARSLSVTVEVIEETYPPELAHVGHARGRALSLAAESLATGALATGALAAQAPAGGQLSGDPDGLLASTDADTVVAPDWAARLRLALASADVVGGRILTLPEERSSLPRAVRRLQLQDAAYHLLAAELEGRLDPDPADPSPRHHQHFGANLGLRLSAWRQIGVWPAVRCLEDVALVEALQRLDLRLRHCPQVRAWTSARACGRVETGLSTQLCEWQTLQGSGQDWLVPGAAERQAVALAGAALRRAWAGQPQCAGHLEGLWMVGTGELKEALHAPTFGRARELAFQARQRAGTWCRAFPPVPVGQAVTDLRALLRRTGRAEIQSPVAEFV